MICHKNRHGGNLVLPNHFPKCSRLPKRFFPFFNLGEQTPLFQKGHGFFGFRAYQALQQSDEMLPLLLPLHYLTKTTCGIWEVPGTLSGRLHSLPCRASAEIVPESRLFRKKKAHAQSMDMEVFHLTFSTFSRKASFTNSVMVLILPFFFNFFTSLYSLGLT